jgi:hypothetical protein
LLFFALVSTTGRYSSSVGMQPDKLTVAIAVISNDLILRSSPVMLDISS